MTREPRILFFASVIFFAVAGSLAMLLDGLSYPSPDETAVRVFIQRVSRGLPFGIPEPLGSEFEDIIHPRSTTIVGKQLVPQGFPFMMVVYGTLTRFTGIPAALWTPLFVAATLPLLFLIFQRIVERQTAFLAALLGFIHPQILYYSVRGLYTNALQISVLLLAVASMLGLRGKGGAFLSGALFALAIAIRPSELPWIGMLLLFVLFFLRRHLTSRLLAFGTVGFVFTLLPVVALHRTIYGGQFVGYPLFVSGAPPVAVHFSIRAMIIHIWQYFFSLLWWWVPFIVVGVYQCWWGSLRMTDALRLYRRTLLTVAMIVVSMYGVWEFRDTISEASYSIGISFARYWLILSVLTLPFAAIGLKKLRLRRVPFVLFVLVSVLFPMLWGPESIRNSFLVSRAAHAMVAAAQREIPPDAVLLVEKSDKIFWPTWRVVVGLDQEQKVLRILPRLAARLPVYFDESRDLTYGSFWSEQRFRSVGLRLDQRVVVSPDHTLYRLVPL